MHQKKIEQIIRPGAMPRVLYSLEAKLMLSDAIGRCTYIEQRNSDNAFVVPSHIGKHNEIVDVIIVSRHLVD
jgi:hypothetical protein